MKKKIQNIIKTFLVFASFVTIVSCSDLNNSMESIREKPILKIMLSENERTVVPNSDFSTFSFELKVGEKILGHYDSSAAVEDDAIDLTKNGITVGDEITFTLTASKDGVAWAGKTTKRIEAGINRLEIKLFVTTIGTGTGSFNYTLDFSEAKNKTNVVSAHIVVRSASDSSATPIINEWYGLNENGTTALKEITNYKIILEQKNVAVGTYHLSAYFFADASVTSKLLVWGENIVVAEGTASTGTVNLDSMNAVYQLTLDKNDGSTPVQKKITYLTDISDLTPSREGHIFRAWCKDSACKEEVLNNNILSILRENPSLTLYAKWEAFAQNPENVSVFDTDTLFVTPENYTIAEVTDENKTLWYKINTTQGNEYKILWVDSGADNRYIYKNNLVNSDSSDFGNYTIHLYDAYGTEITPQILQYNYSDVLFTATSSVTFIAVTRESSSLSGKCAFRVINYNPNEQEKNELFAVVTVLHYDILVLSEEAEEEILGNYGIHTGKYRKYLYFLSKYESEFTDYKLYINGEQVSSSSSYKFYYENYPAGVYTFTMEASKDGQLYSYSAQVTVLETSE